MIPSISTIILIALTMLIAVAVIVIYQVKFTLFARYCQKLYYAYLELFGVDTSRERQRDAENPPQKRPWPEFKKRIILPLGLIFILPFCYFLVDIFFNFEQTSPVVIFVLILDLLLCLCLGFLDHYEKKPQKKFWLQLVIVLSMEVAAAFNLYLITSGYMFATMSEPKTFMNALLFIPIFITYALKLQKSYLQWRHPELLN